MDNASKESLGHRVDGVAIRVFGQSAAERKIRRDPIPSLREPIGGIDFGISRVDPSQFVLDYAERCRRGDDYRKGLGLHRMTDIHGDRECMPQL